jgi:hypothetical protein
MHPMEPVELVGDLVAIEPLAIEHAADLLAAADADEGSPGFRIRDQSVSIKRWLGSTVPSKIEMLTVAFRSRFSAPMTTR